MTQFYYAKIFSLEALSPMIEDGFDPVAPTDVQSDVMQEDIMERVNSALTPEERAILDLRLQGISYEKIKRIKRLTKNQLKRATDRIKAVTLNHTQPNIPSATYQALMVAFLLASTHHPTIEEVETLCSEMEITGYNREHIINHLST